MAVSKVKNPNANGAKCESFSSRERQTVKAAAFVTQNYRLTLP
jgi:hypothetical protein